MLKIENFKVEIKGTATIVLTELHTLFDATFDSFEKEYGEDIAKELKQEFIKNISMSKEEFDKKTDKVMDSMSKEELTTCFLEFMKEGGCLE